MDRRWTILDDRLLIHESYPTPPSATWGYPIARAGDGGRCVIFPDPDEAADMRDLIAPGADLHYWLGMEPLALDVLDLLAAGEYGESGPSAIE